MPISFASDIRPLFRDAPDVNSMKDYGLDLSSYQEVKARAAEIYARLYEGSLERAFDRTLAQLERLQRMRLGQPVPPPIKVNLSA